MRRITAIKRQQHEETQREREEVHSWATVATCDLVVKDGGEVSSLWLQSDLVPSARPLPSRQPFNTPVMAV